MRFTHMKQQVGLLDLRMSKTRRPDFPPMPLPIDELLRSSQWVALDLDGRGLLISLLMACWRDGHLPADPTVAARIAGIEAEDCRRWWDTLAPWFMPHPSGDGSLLAPVLVKPMWLRLKVRAGALNARKGRKGAEPTIGITEAALAEKLALMSRLVEEFEILDAEARTATA
jgi:hypothetical protein